MSYQTFNSFGRNLYSKVENKQTNKPHIFPFLLSHLSQHILSISVKHTEQLRHNNAKARM